MTTDVADDTPNDGAAGLRMKLATMSFGILLAWIALELVLRIVPQVISPRVLILFEPGLRAEIAKGAFPLEKDFRPVVRDDGGPPLVVAKPGTPIISVDKPPGDVPRVNDEAGFCNPPGSYAGRERLDVITIGDSFTWCHALLPDQTWTAGIQARTGLVSYDLGLGGLGLYEYVQLLRDTGLAKHPRIVIMNVYGGNDLRDAVEYHEYRKAIEAGRAPPMNQPASLAPALAASFVGRHSYALNFLVATVSRAVYRVNDQEKKSVNFHYTVDAAEGPVEFNIENRDRDEVVAALHVERSIISPELWGDALARFGALGKEHGFRPIVAYTPSAQIVYGERAHFEDPSIVPVLRALDDAQRSYLADHAGKLGYEFFDLTPALREAAKNFSRSELLYGAVHLHYSARGHEVVAAALAKYLTDSGAATAAAH